LKAYQIQVNGQEYAVEIGDLSTLPIKVVVNGQSFEVTIDQRGVHAAERPLREDMRSTPDDDLMLDTYVPTVATTYLEVTPEPEAVDGQPPAEQAPGEGREIVVAPMPGTVLDIVVKIGDAVQQGDTLCNLEAMKMKSPIRSPGKGTVEQILIGEGQNVAFGDALFILG
jgi:biotin carboxyl carrier protein